MYVKSIVLDGFKSYGTRTEISGFDQEFNAITGLNGSGKSNILDAICFVLGLTNLNQVRAVLLQDLVYKQGQTGVSKASVTITFDNRNKKQSPVGYESCDEITVTRQVILGGKNKYLINGVNAPNNRVKDLFCSVQLNVNNPHFLVMQGRITKVLNMKPLEILSMIEEATGTSMFEAKKVMAERTLEKKDMKLMEIDSKIEQEIAPDLERCKQDREQYLAFKQVERELEHLQKINSAWRYMMNKKKSEEAKTEADGIIRTIDEKRKAIEFGQSEIENIKEHVAALQKAKSGESEGQLKQLDDELTDKEKLLTAMVCKQKQNADNIKDEVKYIEELENNIKDDSNLLKKKSTDLSKIGSVFQRLADEEETDRLDLEKAQKKFQALSSGLVADDSGTEGTLQDKLMEAERNKAQAQTEIEQCKRQRVHCQADLKKKTSEMQKTATDADKDKKILDKLNSEVKTLTQQLNALGFDEAHVTAMRQEESVLKGETRKLREQRDTVENKDGRLVFRYTDPEPNFKRKSVHGLVCKLIDFSNPEFAIAIEKTAGARLFNVVVDTDITSKKLLSHGKLERRTTIIPLNKISGRRVDGRTVAAARRLVGADNVWPAIELIQFDPVLSPAMDYIFGSTFVCRDLATAKKVCYHPDIKTKCVTLDGDTCDPSGTLSGGARQQSASVLLMLREIKHVLHELDIKDARLTEIQRELQQLAAQAERYYVIKQKLDLQQHELLMITQRMQQTTHYQYQEEVNRLKQQLVEFTEKEKLCQDLIAKETERIKTVQNELKNAKANRESQLKNVENEVKRLKKKAEQSRKDREKRNEEHDSLKLELEDLRKSIENHREQIELHKQQIVSLEEADAKLVKEIAEIKKDLASLQTDVKALKDTINKKNKEIAQTLQRQDKIVKDVRDGELQIKQLQQNRDKLIMESRECKSRVAELLKQNDWIPEEEKYFGQPNGLYDFNETNLNDIPLRLGQLKELKEKLGRNINTKAMNALAKSEEMYNDLLKKRQQVEYDKIKIQEVIHDLGEKKKDAVKQACLKVNEDFSSIFSTLLPGAVAKLESADGQSVLSGLEFKVGFGGKWKESLGELSGGQRSLVALSLILAMLLFKPAPIYILDEVDAALDLSHTQNIGNMLKTHFKTSQFIIVSLKDGMFNNANVLFRTKFIDGMSTITRTEQARRQ